VESAEHLPEAVSIDHLLVVLVSEDLAVTRAITAEAPRTLTVAVGSFLDDHRAAETVVDAAAADPVVERCRPLTHQNL
jgi:hypothetical protein